MLRESSRGWDIAVSAAGLIVATALTFALWDPIFHRFPFALYFAAVALAASRAGWIAGIGAGAAGVLIVGMSQRFTGELAAASLVLLGVSAVISFLAASRDRAKWSRRQSDTRHAAIVNASLDCIISMDDEGRIIEWNPAAERTFGHSPPEALGHLLADLIIPAQYADAHRAGLARYLVSGEGPVIGKRLEITAIRSSGEEFPVELTVTRVPMPGAPVFTGHVRDISDRRRAEAAVAESEAKFRQLAETIPQLAWMANSDGFIYWYNRRWYEYTNTTPEQMEGWGWQQVHDPVELPRVMEGWKHSILTGEPFDMEFPLRRADGAFRWFLTRVAPLRDAEGRIVQWFGTNTDIEDRRNLAEERTRLLDSERAARAEAERASRMKDEFLANLSHELRTPLNAILGWSQILAGGTKDEKELADGLKTIERNARAQNQIIEDLLDMSRIVSGKVRLDVQRVDLSAVVQAAVETVKPAADAKGVRLHVVLDPLAAPVSGDPNRLQQVFWNLLTNSVKFTPRGGRVQVLLERVNSHLEVSIVDTGEGISPEFLPHVFDRFRQADATTTRRHGGLGLGLAIVKQLVELHGGEVRAKSPGTGNGSTFTVMFPLTIVHPEPNVELERRHPKSASSPFASEPCADIAGMKILVVDDETDSRALVKRLLENCGAEVIVAASADEALRMVQTDHPDVIASDIGMPNLDGYELIRLVRALGPSRGGDTPAIALTAYARAEDRVRAVMAGFQHHVAKPVEPAELIAMVASLGKARK